MAETTEKTAAEKSAATRKKNAAKRSTTAKKAAATRASNRGAAARSTTASTAKTTATRTRTSAAKQAANAKSAVKSPIGRAGELAERSVLVPVGAGLIARERLLDAVGELRTTYSTRTKARNELRRFERRGTSALKSIEGDAKKTRTRVERELRGRRSRIEKDVRAVIKDIETRTGPVVKNVELVGARVENAVQGGRTAATKATATMQERIASLA